MTILPRRCTIIKRREIGVLVKIEFIPSTMETELFIPAPRPASKFIPEWYKDKKKYNGLSRFDAAHKKNPGIKNCMPFLDAMTAGYIQETWCDILIRYDNNANAVEYLYPEISPPPLSLRTD